MAVWGQPWMLYGWCEVWLMSFLLADGLGMKTVGCDDGGCVAENLNEIYIFKWPK